MAKLGSSAVLSPPGGLAHPKLKYEAL